MSKMKIKSGSVANCIILQGGSCVNLVLETCLHLIHVSNIYRHVFGHTTYFFYILGHSKPNQAFVLNLSYTLKNSVAMYMKIETKSHCGT